MKGRRLLLLVFALTVLAACGGGEPDLCDNYVCTSGCEGDSVQCAFDGVEATGGSCNHCRLHLYAELCALGSEATVDEVDAGMVCDEGDTGA